MSNHARVPTLSTFSEAAKHYEKIKPFKASSFHAGKRPLGAVRRYDSQRITLDRMTSGQEVVKCSLYNTDVVTYVDDGSIVLKHDGFETVSTMDFINSLLRYRFGHSNPVSKVKGKLYLREIREVREVDGSHTMSPFFHRFDSKLVIQADGSIDGGATEYTYELNKERMAKLRDYFADFTEYCKYVSQINSGKTADRFLSIEKLAIHPTDFKWAGTTYKSNARNFFNRLMDGMSYPKDSPERLEEFAYVGNQLFLNAADLAWDPDPSLYTYQCIPPMMRKFFNELCRYEFAEGLFERKEVPKGTLVRDDNAHYLNLGSDRELPFNVAP